MHDVPWKINGKHMTNCVLCILVVHWRSDHHRSPGHDNSRRQDGSPRLTPASALAKFADFLFSPACLTHVRC